ncbi:MAG: DNA polymerase III subunit epsilon [Gammaproteobacteria bacterium]|nr:DNA polymerase III subunit epsilon [Gammaproteobacteria bacterium]MBT8094768.1 DNA polymerase III subunit epsilon [Gammaproteobacteria bacterium]
MRQIVLDTETTGLSASQGHRIIEIGCIEMVNRRLTGREFHRFLNPERDIDEGAEAVHGISRAQLETEPLFRDIVDEFLDFVRDAELIIHNAEFDVGFLEQELRLMQYPRPKITDHCLVLDTLKIAREVHPGQRNSLDALCKRYNVDASKRDVHGALIDSDLLAQVYLAMTGGQSSLLLDEDGLEGGASAAEGASAPHVGGPAGPNQFATVAAATPVIEATADEIAAHDGLLEKMRKSGACVWDFE